MVLRTGLLGYGIAGRVFHAPLIAATAGLELSAVVTADPARRAQVREAYPGVGLPRTAEELFGPVSAVYGELDPRRPGVEVDDDVFVALTHVSGVRSHLWANSAAPHHGPRFRVLGSVGAYVSDGLDRQEDALAAGKPFDDLSTSGRLGLLDDVEEVAGLPGAYSEFYRLLVVALRDGGPLPVEPESAVRALEVIEAAFTSARTGQVVSV